MFDYGEIINELNKLERGKPRIQYIKKCISVADREGQLRYAMELRFNLMRESIVYSDGYDCVLNFPEYMARIDSLSLAEAAPYTQNFMTCFMWYLQTAEGYYQIVKKTVEELRKEYKKRCKKYGYSLRAYYMMKIEECDRVEWLPHLLKFLRKEKRDELSGGRMFELYLEISSEIKLENICYALELEKIFYAEDPEKSTGYQNDLLYSINIKFALYFYNKREYEKAKPYVIKAYEYIVSNPHVFGGVSSIITMFIEIDYKSGLEAWKVLIGRILHLNNPSHKYYTFKASTSLFIKLMNNGIHFIEFYGFPESFPGYKKSGKYNVKQLYGWFYNEALELAKKFDENDEDADFEKSIKKYNIYERYK